MNIQDSICIHDGCDKPRYKNKAGFCAAHYGRQFHGRTMDKRCVECEAIIPAGTHGSVRRCLKCMANPCIHKGCDKPRHEEGWCSGHYYRQLHGVAMDRFCVECEAIIPPGTVSTNGKHCLKCTAKTCKHDGCDKPKHNETSGLCAAHYKRQLNGKAMDRHCVQCEAIIPVGTGRKVNYCLKCKAKPCIHDVCDKPKYSKKSGLCAAHYYRQLRGSAMDVRCVECEAIIPVDAGNNMNRCLKCKAKPCIHKGCDKPKRTKAAGYCLAHCRRQLNGKAMDRHCVECEAIIPAGTGKWKRCLKCTAKPCKHEGCDKPRYATDLCSTHHGRHRIGKAMDSKPHPIGATRISGTGYVTVKVSDKGKWPLEHRLKMEKKLGRPLERHETVHHKNTVRHDNDIKNLELWSHSHLPGGRVEDRINFYVQDMSLYIEDLFERSKLIEIRDKIIAGLP